MVFTKGWYLNNPHPRGNAGKSPSLESRKKMSIAGIGRVFTEEHKKRIAMSRMGDKHPLWKGDNIKRGASLHEWVRRRLMRPERCQECQDIPHPRKDGKCALDLANVSQKYLRDLSDWEWLCRPCHMRKDGITQKLIKYNKARDNSGDKNPLWKGGTPKCMDCGAMTGSSYKANRCRPCYLKLKVRGPRK